MALTADKLRIAVRAGDSPAEKAILTRLRGVAAALIERYAPGAPGAVKDEACVRIVGYLYDQPNAGRGVAYANALRHSGAQALLMHWRVRRAGVIG